MTTLHRRAGALLLAAVLHAGAAAQPGADPAALTVTEAAPGVYVHAGAVEDWGPDNGGDVANLGFVVGSRCVAVIDTGGTPQVGQRWRAAVERATHLPICYVFDTHAHPDHVLGNAAFAGPETRFVASAKFNAAMAAREPYYLRALARDFGIEVTHDAVVYPTIAVDGTQEFDLGDRVLVAQSWPTAHTDNDLTVYDRSTRTLFASDLLFVQHIPVVDGKLRGWLRAMPQLAQIDAALIVPGHGPLRSGGPDAWKPQQEYLETLLRETRAALKSGKTLSQAVASVATEAASHWQLAERFHRRNVTAAYAELEWED
ncbi:MAG TPA: quinoprotein relay system zinc metallohydrolase 2 [Burkholderiaceae bacterium]|nr:quinoprotein relay system zinc metallohydrolase 2 [Burkholderiaceae bacterium]